MNLNYFSIRLQHDKMCKTQCSKNISPHSFGMSRRFYPVSARDWFTLDTVELEYGDEKAVFDGRRNIYAPAEYSYHCASVNSFSPALLERTESGSNTSHWWLSFRGFQVRLCNALAADALLLEILSQIKIQFKCALFA